MEPTEEFNELEPRAPEFGRLQIRININISQSNHMHKVSNGQTVSSSSWAISVEWSYQLKAILPCLYTI